MFKLFQSPLYFFFVAVIGYGAWVGVFFDEIKAVSTKPSKIDQDVASTRTPQNESELLVKNKIYLSDSEWNELVKEDEFYLSISDYESLNDLLSRHSYLKFDCQKNQSHGREFVFVESKIRRNFENFELDQKLIRLGIDKKFHKTIIKQVSLLAMYVGIPQATHILRSYIEKRYKMSLSFRLEDFDFEKLVLRKNEYTEEKNNLKKAILHVLLPLARSQKISISQYDLIQELPFAIKNSFQLSFSEYVIYKQNNFDETQNEITKGYLLRGIPGVLNLISASAQQDRNCKIFQFLKLSASSEFESAN